MSDQPKQRATAPDRRAARHRETKAEIVAAAWELARANGLAGLSMRDLGRRVGMRAQSVYSYFESKNDIYDAMFHDGYLRFISEVNPGVLDATDDPVGQLREYARQFFRFCVSDPVRFQLLFQRTIPGFEPSDPSWAVAREVYVAMTTRLATLGITDPAGADLWTAVVTGLASQQIANDPSGDRWERLVDRAVVMTLREMAPRLLEPTDVRR